MVMVFTAAHNLSETWRHCCLKALGLEDWVLLEEDYDNGTQIVEEEKDPSAAEAAGSSTLLKFEVINLLPKGTKDGDANASTTAAPATSADPWMATALQIQSNLRDMADWMEQKRRDYVSLQMPDEEATLIQSTITSFVATTASEIESLHQCLTKEQHHHNHPQWQQHCTGIVQILMSQLQQGIAEPFGRLQKQRQRPAVQLWQTPLQCRLWTPQQSKKQAEPREKDPTLELLGLDDDDSEPPVDQRFQPTRPSHRLHRNFWDTYRSTKIVKRLPKPGFAIAGEAAEPTKFQVTAGEEAAGVSAVPRTAVSQQQQRKRHQQQKQQMILDDEQQSDDTTDAAARMQQESLALQAETVHHDLDSVQQLEQTMVDITALLGQFANLVAEQQENVHDIRDSAESTKDNLEQGEENLHRATEATGASSHLWAKGVFAMASLLLLLNWLVA